MRAAESESVQDRRARNELWWPYLELLSVIRRESLSTLACHCLAPPSLVSDAGLSSPPPTGGRSRAVDSVSECSDDEDEVGVLLVAVEGGVDRKERGASDKGVRGEVGVDEAGVDEGVYGAGGGKVACSGSCCSVGCALMVDNELSAKGRNGMCAAGGERALQ